MKYDRSLPRGKAEAANGMKNVQVSRAAVSLVGSVLIHLFMALLDRM